MIFGLFTLAKNQDGARSTKNSHTLTCTTIAATPSLEQPSTPSSGQPNTPNNLPLYADSFGVFKHNVTMGDELILAACDYCINVASGAGSGLGLLGWSWSKSWSWRYHKRFRHRRLTTQQLTPGRRWAPFLPCACWLILSA